MIYKPNPVTSRLLPKNKKQYDFIFQNTFYNLLQITLDIFAKTVIGDPKSKTPIQAKRKDVPKKKNNSRLVQDNRKLIEKKEKEKVLGV